MKEQDRQLALMTALETAKRKYDTMPLLIKRVQDEKKAAAATVRQLRADYAKLEKEVRGFYIEMTGPIKRALQAIDEVKAIEAGVQPPTPAKKSSHAKGRA